ncbi:M23 family metallopeptidase [Kordia algicida OT-1]|uniref:Metalloendopeptidase n=1 Tax=Kordia algicida OT-1 TaxID=391587 RepID=A9EBG5_9FLAO|nr:M23 family metallopeptidase [Kordia algicida]EDP94468.1 Metalloendopeptidase [Kordia algicida OT-1]
MKRKIGITILIIIIIGYLIPENFSMPVQNATSKDYNKESFWYYPWGKSVTHKGVDIFAKKGTQLNTATAGIVLYAGTIDVGGNVVIVLGPKWKLHYYAHLDSITTSNLSYVSPNEQIGTIGDSGNARGKSPHVHYAIATIIPYPWKIDSDRQGWKKMFYLNPIEYLEEARK